MDLGIGDALRDARRRSGSSLADASAETRVRESYLAALEQEDFASLGSDVYVRGFITSYARYLDLDPAPLLAAYRAGAESGPEPRDPARSARAARAARASRAPATTAFRSRSRRRRRQPVGPMLLAGALVAVVLLFLLLRGGGDDTAAALTGLAVAGLA